MCETERTMMNHDTMIERRLINTECRGRNGFFIDRRIDGWISKSIRGLDRDPYGTLEVLSSSPHTKSAPIYFKFESIQDINNMIEVLEFIKERM